MRGHQDICVSTFLFDFKRTGLWFCVLVLDRYFSAIKDGKTSLLLSTFVKKLLPLNIQQGCMSHREKHYYVKGKKEKSMSLFYIRRSTYQRLMCFTGTWDTSLNRKSAECLFNVSTDVLHLKTHYLTEISEKDSKVCPGITLVEYQSIFTKAQMFFPEEKNNK